jgi:hypothetical protein
MFLWPLLEYSPPLPDRKPDPRPMLDCRSEQFASLFKIVAGVKEATDRPRDEDCLSPRQTNRYSRETSPLSAASL